MRYSRQAGGDINPPPFGALASIVTVWRASGRWRHQPAPDRRSCVDCAGLAGIGQEALQPSGRWRHQPAPDRRSCVDSVALAVWQAGMDINPPPFGAPASILMALAGRLQLRQRKVCQ